MRYVALLRGINVGGNNIIKMAALRAAFERSGFTDVTTYIASGNVLFCAPSTPKPKLTLAIEKMLSETFAYASCVVVVSAKELARVIDEIPAQFGSDATRFHYDVIFVKEPLTTAEALAEVTAHPEVDAVAVGKHALYFRRLKARATSSHLAKIVGRPVYKSLTIRNWNTTKKLSEMISV